MTGREDLDPGNAGQGPGKEDRNQGRGGLDPGIGGPDQGREQKDLLPRDTGTDRVLLTEEGNFVSLTHNLNITVVVLVIIYP